LERKNHKGRTIITTNNYEEMFIITTNNYEEMSPVFRITVLVNKKPSKPYKCSLYGDFLTRRMYSSRMQVLGNPIKQER